MGKVLSCLKRFWNFVWHGDSLASWVVSVILAFVLVKFIIYPGIGFMFSTTHPIVAVVSGSMEHKTVYANGKYSICGNQLDGEKSLDFAEFWGVCGDFYKEIGINKGDFKRFRFRNGFNTGDIMFIFGTKPKNIKVGNVVVFKSKRTEPIIHRVVQIRNEGEKLVFMTKGDHNSGSGSDEKSIPEENIVGKAVLRIPVLGYVKIIFVRLLGFVGMGG